MCVFVNVLYSEQKHFHAVISRQYFPSLPKEEHYFENDHLWPILILKVSQYRRECSSFWPVHCGACWSRDFLFIDVIEGPQTCITCQFSREYMNDMAESTRRKVDLRTAKEKRFFAMAKWRWDADSDVAEYDDPVAMQTSSDEDDSVTVPVKRCWRGLSEYRLVYSIDCNYSIGLV